MRTTRDTGRQDTREQRAAPVGSVTQVGERQRRGVFSDGSVDRFNTTISPAGWQLDNFRRNPIFLYDHDLHGLPLGRVVDVNVVGEQLVGTVEFFTDDINPEATRRMKALDAGVGGFSIRFNGATAKATYNVSRETGDERDLFFPPLDYVETELIELSLVNVGANAHSLPSARSLTPEESARIAALRDAAKNTTRRATQERTVEEILKLLAGLSAADKQKLLEQLQQQVNQTTQDTTTNGGGTGGNTTASAEGANAGTQGTTQGTSTQTAEQGRSAERARITGIHELCKRAGIDDDERVKRFITEGTSVADVRSKLFDEMVERQTPSNNQHAGTVTGGETEDEKFARGVVAAIISRAGKRSLIEAAKARKVPGLEKVDTDPGEFRGLRAVELARRALERRGVKVVGRSEMDVVGAALMQDSRAGGTLGTSDFPILMTVAAERILLASYGIQAHVWKRIARTEELKDFKPSSRLRAGSIPNLKPKNEHGEFESVAITDAEKTDISTDEAGVIIKLTRKLLVNDDLGAFADMVQRAGEAADRTIEDAVFALLAANAGAGPTMSDAQPFFHANRKNLGAASGLTADGVDADLVLMGSQTDKDGNYVSIMPSVLLVGMGQAMKAKILNTSATDPDIATKVGRPNGVAGKFNEIVASPRVAGTKRYLLADPNINPAIVVAFLEGQTEPKIETKDQWTTSGVDLRVVHDSLAQVFDPRAAVYNPGA